MLFPCEGFLLLRPGMTLSPVILSLVTLSFVLLPVMAVLGLDPGIGPGHPDAVRRSALRIEITGTSPVMTSEGAVGGYEGRRAQADPGA
jgi:hypothetical protein